MSLSELETYSSN
ncbi:hypothetical protein VTN00DRAFT_8610 [Thermoascus crustaceus]